MLQFVKKYSEVIIWNGALILLAFMDVESTTSFCILKNIGFSWCPGCGIGHAIHHALHFEFQKSLEAHFMGIPGAIIIFYQSCKTIYTINKINKTQNNGSTTTIKNVPGHGI